MVERRGRLLRAAAVTALLATSAVGGCSASSDSPATVPSAEPSASDDSAPASSPSPDASSAPTAPAAPRPPRARKGPDGQKAFARFVMDAWSWSLRTNDASPLLEASPSRKRPCDGCRALERELDGRAEEGWYVDFPGLVVERTRLRRAGDAVVAVSQVAIPQSDSYQLDGSYRSTSPAHDDATFTVTMRFDAGRYRLVSFAVG